MPWQAVQFLRITNHTGPSGRVTCGRAGRRPIWAYAGRAKVARSQKPEARRRTGCAEVLRMVLSDRQRSGARAETLALDPVEMEEAQEHVRCPLCIVREHDVAIALES